MDWQIWYIVCVRIGYLKFVNKGLCFMGIIVVYEYVAIFGIGLCVWQGIEGGYDIVVGVCCGDDVDGFQ